MVFLSGNNHSAAGGRLAVLVYFPIAFALTLGQVTTLYFPGVDPFVFLWRSDRDLAAGPVVSSTAIRTLTVLGLAMSFLFARLPSVAGLLWSVYRHCPFARWCWFASRGLSNFRS